MKNRNKGYSLNLYTSTSKKHIKINNQYSTPEKIKKTTSRINLTNQKYIQAKMEFTEHKQANFQKMLSSKNKRIQELQIRLSESQCLVREAIQKWKNSRQQEQEQYELKTNELILQNKELREKLKEKESQASRQRLERIAHSEKYQQLQGQYQQLEGKFEAMEKKYQQDKIEWKKASKNFQELKKYIEPIIGDLNLDQG